MPKSFTRASYLGKSPLNWLFLVIASANVLVTVAVGFWLA